jgi:hypothetical protein
MNSAVRFWVGAHQTAAGSALIGDFASNTPPSALASRTGVLSSEAAGLSDIQFSLRVEVKSMLDEEFKKERARTVRGLAERANDPFIKGRLLDLISRYEDGGSKTPTRLMPVDLQFESRGTGSER